MSDYHGESSDNQVGSNKELQHSVGGGIPGPPGPPPPPPPPPAWRAKPTHLRPVFREPSPDFFEIPPDEKRRKVIIVDYPPPPEPPIIEVVRPRGPPPPTRQYIIKASPEYRRSFFRTETHIVFRVVFKFFTSEYRIPIKETRAERRFYFYSKYLSFKSERKRFFNPIQRVVYLHPEKDVLVLRPVNSTLTIESLYSHMKKRLTTKKGCSVRRYFLFGNPQVHSCLDTFHGVTSPRDKYVWGLKTLIRFTK